MQTIDEIRRARLEALIQERGSIAALNEALGLDRTDSTLSQIRTQARHSSTGKPRTMGDELARRIEERLQLPRGWMDTSLELERQAADPQAAAILAMLGQLPEWQRERVATIVRTFVEAASGAPPPSGPDDPKRE